MASFCTRCGASVPEGTQFCTACGTPVGANPAPPPQPAASPAWTPVAVAPAQQPVQQRSGGAVKVILIVVGAFVGLGILCVALFMFGLWRVSRAVHVSNDGSVKISTPQGTLSAGSSTRVSAADLGIDIYPGAARREGGMQITTAKGSTVSAIFSTDDPMDKVVSFYKDKMGQGISVFENEQGAILTMNGADSKSSVVVTISTDTNAADGHTKIAIMHTKST
jgi:zinc-ribbon domain